MKIYTRGGDAGRTALLGGGRVGKDHPRVEAYGTVDELNAVLGESLARLQDPASRERLSRIQHDLFTLGAILAAVPGEDGAPLPGRPPELPEERVAEMEAWIDEADAVLPPLRAFVLPGGSPGAAALHVARTVCRRAERRVVGARSAGEAVPEAVVAYLNRLGDLLFVLARLENHRAGEADVEWRK